MKSIFAAFLIALLPATLVGQGAPNVRAAALAWNWTYPNNIAGLQFWVKAEGLALNDGDTISTWPDSSGKGRDASQGVGLLQPSYRASVLAGKPVARFDQVADLMTTANFSLAQPCEAFIVTKYNQARLTNDTLFDGTTTGMRVFRSGTTPRLDMTAGTVFGGNIVMTPETFHVHRFIFAGDTSSNSFDGGFTRVGAAGTNNAGGVTLNSTAIGTLWGGQDMAEMIVYSPALTATDRRKIERYLSLKYALPLQN